MNKPRAGLRWPASAGFVLTLAVGCSQSSARLSWHFTFATQELADRAEYVSAEIRAGGCRGKLVFETRLIHDGAGVTPGPLQPGRYGLRGRAADGACLWVAEGCVEVDLPCNDVVSVTLQEDDTPQTSWECARESPARARLFDGGSDD